MLRRTRWLTLPLLFGALLIGGMGGRPLGAPHSAEATAASNPACGAVWCIDIQLDRGAGATYYVGDTVTACVNLTYKGGSAPTTLPVTVTDLTASAGGGTNSSVVFSGQMGSQQCLSGPVQPPVGAETLVAATTLPDGLNISADIQYFTAYQATITPGTGCIAGVAITSCPCPSTIPIPVTIAATTTCSTNPGVAVPPTNVTLPTTLSLQSPQANVSCTPSQPNVGDVVQCSASASTSNPGAAIQSYTWDFGAGDGTTATGPSATYTYAASGGYTVTASVADTAGQTTTASTQVQVKPGGVWLGPCLNGPVSSNYDGKQCDGGAKVYGPITFSVLAYPTHTDIDPKISHVNFTAQINGSWITPPQCKNLTASVNGVYSCAWDPQNRIAEGTQIVVSFDVYDTNGNVNQSPNGEHILTWASCVHCLQIPFVTQIGSDGQGGDNCGPASLTMAVNTFGNGVQLATMVTAIRTHSDNPNGPAYYHTGDTQFRDQHARSVLQVQYGLLTDTNIASLSDIKSAIDAGRPVVIVLNNATLGYADGAHAYDGDSFETIYPPDPDSSGWYTPDHIVVVTGYDGGNIYVNDPLRDPAYAVTPQNLPIPNDKFTYAAENSTGNSPWSAMSVWSPQQPSQPLPSMPAYAFHAGAE